MLTLMGMVPFLKIEMDHVTRSGGAFSTSSGGIGDIKLVAMYTVARPDRQRLILQFGMGVFLNAESCTLSASTPE